MFYEFSPDILHISSPVSNDVFLIWVANKLRIPIIMTYHADFSGFLGKIFMKFLEPIFYPLVDRIFVQSDRDQKYLVRRGIPKFKIELFYFNGVDANIFHPSNPTKSEYSTPRQILFVGKIDRMHRHKGFDLLFNAFVAMRKKETNIMLKVAGGGDLESFFKESAIAMKLDGIEFLGHISLDSLVSNMQNSDILVLPSRNEGEGFGKVVLEAISCELPVVVSKYAGISSIVEKYGCGAIVDPFDTQAFVSTLVSTLNDKDAWIQYKRNCKIMIDSEKLQLCNTVIHTLDTYKVFINK